MLSFCAGPCICTSSLRFLAHQPRDGRRTIASLLRSTMWPGPCQTATTDSRAPRQYYERAIGGVWASSGGLPRTVTYPHEALTCSIPGFSALSFCLRFEARPREGKTCICSRTHTSASGPAPSSNTCPSESLSRRGEHGNGCRGMQRRVPRLAVNHIQREGDSQTCRMCHVGCSTRRICW